MLLATMFITSISIIRACIAIAIKSIAIFYKS